MNREEMIKRLIHFSDLHIRLFKDHDQYRGIIESALKEWKSLQPDRIVFTGDLVHSKNQMTPELVEFVAWILSECAKITKTIVIIGNHDFLENNSSRMDALSPVIDSLKNDDIVYLKNRGEYEDDNVDWVVYSLLDHNIPPEIEKTGRLKIGLFHGPVQGLTTDIGYKFETGFETDKFNGCDLVLCGDIHKRQVFRVGKTPVIMVGSFIQQNFGETVSEHGFNVVSLGTEITYEFHDIENPVKYLTFKISDISDIEEQNELLINA